MTKTIESTHPLYPGTVELPDGLTFIQLLDFSDAQVRVKPTLLRQEISTVRVCHETIDSINMIASWHIDGLPEKPTAPDIFGGKPTIEAGRFYMWVFAQVQEVWRNENTPPKVQSPEPTYSPKTAETTGPAS